jgi:hypothetical protein
MNTEKISRIGSFETRISKIFFLPKGSFSKILLLVLVALGGGSHPALPADYRAGPPRVIEGIGPEIAEGYGYGLDPRCRIIPSPQKSLVGDVWGFSPIAVCQSRGLYADSVSIPDPWFPFNPYR